MHPALQKAMVAQAAADTAAALASLVEGHARLEAALAEVLARVDELAAAKAPKKEK